MRFPPLTLPVARPSDEPTEMVCLNHDWVIEMLSLCERLQFQTAWVAPVDEFDMITKVLELEQILVRASAMSCCCKNPTNRRYNSNGQLEVSYDGGLTWSLAPDADSRMSGALSPPLAGADGETKRCLGAASAMEFAKRNLIDDLTTGGTYADLYAALVALAAVLGVTGIGILIAAAAAAIFIAGVSAVQAAFTSEVWDDYQCILYCASEDNASFTEQGWQQVKSEINSQFSGVVAVILYNWVNSVGPVGLTNAARSGFAASADCSECDCPGEWCYFFAFDTAGAEDWEKSTTDGFNNGVMDIGTGWLTTDTVNVVQNPDTGNRAIYIMNNHSITTITKVVMTYSIVAGSYDATFWDAAFIALNGLRVTSVTRLEIVNGTNVTLTWEGSQSSVTKTELFLRSSRDNSAPHTYSGSASIRSVRVEGLGFNPFGDDNCIEG